MIPTQIPIGAAIVVVKTAQGVDAIAISSPPGVDFDHPEERTWQESKWRTMAGESFDDVKDISRALIQGGNNSRVWDHLTEIVKG